MTYSNVLDVLNAVDSERLAIWQRHPDWSEEQRQLFYAQRKAQIASFFGVSPTQPRGLHREQDRTLALDQDVDQGHIEAGYLATDDQVWPSLDATPTAMSRSSTGAISTGYHLKSNPTQPRRSGSKRQHDSIGMAHSASYTYGSTAQHTNGGSTGRRPNPRINVTAHRPADYVSKLECSSDINSSHHPSKRQRVEGHDGFARSCTARGSGSLVNPSPAAYDLSYVPTNVTPSTSLSSSSLSPLSALTPASSETMSRQSSMTSAGHSTSSLIGAVDMMRVESDISACSSDLPCSFEHHQDLDASFLSSSYASTEKPASSSHAMPGYGENIDLSQAGGYAYGVGGQEPFPFCDVSPIVAGAGTWYGGSQYPIDSEVQGQDMQRSLSDQSTSAAQQKLDERRRKHIENGKRVIVSKCIPGGPKSTQIGLKQETLDAKATVAKPKQAIEKSTYVRPQHDKLVCNICDEYPGGFRGEHELRRHHDRAHTTKRKVWICVDPLATDPKHKTTEGWRPTRPLDICKQCKQRKTYNVYYNAAAHLRRAHFCPRKRGRKARGEEREARAGKAGGDWPPIEWLKLHGWLKEIEVRSTDCDESGTIEEEQQDDLVNDFDESNESFQPNFDMTLDPYQQQLAFETLFPGGEFQQMPPTTDTLYGYPTPAADPTIPVAMPQWTMNMACPPQAQMTMPMQHVPPPMEYSLSAPPAMVTNDMNLGMMSGMNLDGSFVQY